MPKSLAEIADAKHEHKWVKSETLFECKTKGCEKVLFGQLVSKMLAVREKFLKERDRTVLAAQVQGCDEEDCGECNTHCGFEHSKRCSDEGEGVWRCPVCRFCIEFGWGVAGSSGEKEYEAWRKEHG